MTNVIVLTIATLTSTIGAYLALYYAYKAAVVAERCIKVMKRVETNTNGKIEELLALTKKSSFAEGKKAGHDETISS